MLSSFQYTEKVAIFIKGWNPRNAIKQSFCVLLCLSFLSMWTAKPGWTATERGQLGIYVQNLTLRVAQANKLSSEEGVVVVGIMKGSPAEQSGLQRGDLIIGLNKQTVKNVTELQSLVAKLPLGSAVTLSIIREGNPLEIHTTVYRSQTAEQDLPRFVVDGRLWGVLLFLVASFLLLVGIGNFLLPRLYHHLSEGTLLSSLVLTLSHRWIIWGGGIGIILFLLWTAITVIPPGRRGVVFNLFSGMHPVVLSEGVHFLFPFIDQVTVYNTLSQTYTIQSGIEKQGTKQEKVYGLWMPTRDGMKIGIDVTVRYRLDPSQLVELHRNVGLAYEAKIVHPLVQNMVRIVIAQFRASELFTNQYRFAQEEIFARLKEAFIQDGVLCEAIFLENIHFPPGYEATLQQEMLAAQKIQELTFEVTQAEKRSQARLYEAEGESQALEIINQSLQNRPHLLQYIWIKQLPSSVDLLVVPPGLGKIRGKHKKFPQPTR